MSVSLTDDVNRWRITFDGGAGGTVEVSRPGNADVKITGLSDDVHSVRIEKMSESPAPALFGGIFVEAGGALPPPAPEPRLIEFIGDSDTVGFGDTSKRRGCNSEESFAATDTTASFGPRVSSAFGADYRMIARSGAGLVRNYAGVDGDKTIPSLYTRALPDNAEIRPTKQIAADVVVVAIGSNDFGSDLQPHERWHEYAKLRSDFEAALIKFLRDRHRDNPQALFVLLAFGENGEELVGAYRAADRALRQDGARDAIVILPKLERRGCNFHPSQRDHAMIADELITAISTAEPGWRKAGPTIHQ